MKNLGMNDLRKSYIDFFGNEKGHTILKSFPLIPQDDESLLLINAGMAPLKQYFTGEKKIKNNRATSSQRCVRTGDIERVGKTERHGTYFEMLGNFSFGDYFKREAITWAYEFLTGKLEIAQEDLWVTVYYEDEEAYNIWKDEVGINPDRILKQDKDENFWELEVGPCGPCSEIYVDRGADRAIDENDNAPGNDDSDRFMEIWNLVFTQYNKDADGNYTPLAHPNIDTGMGLERIAMILQGKDNIFEIDVNQDIISEIEKISEAKYKSDKKSDVSIRVIADHAKAMTFLVSDGVLPSNEKRGYVLRRLIRRAYRHGKLLGIDGEFLSKIVAEVIEAYKVEYEDLVANKENIIKVIVEEEERFQHTIDSGLERLNSLINDMKSSGQTVLDGSEAFKLYDTYGFPLDLTKEILSEEDFDLDEDKFNQEMENQRELARNARKSDSGWSLDNIVTDGINPTEFIGYEILKTDATITNIFDESENISSLSQGESGIVVSDKTSFYAQGGGQVADTGFIYNENTKAKVTDVQKKNDVYFHSVEVIEGTIECKQNYTFEVYKERRYDITRNHSATHLLDQALRDVLGDDISQAGSLVDENKLRFDFTYNESLTNDQKQRIEDIINEKIREQLPVDKRIVSFNESQEMGAIGLFEDKYKENVRVVSIGDYSKELCGGCHVNNSSEVLIFKIVSESSVSAGVRRIEAITGKKVYELMQAQKQELDNVADILNANPNVIIQKINSLKEEIENQKDEIKRLKCSSNKDVYKDLEKSIENKDNVNIVIHKFDNATMDELRDYENRLKNNYENLLLVFASVIDDKIIFTVTVDDNLTDRYDAGKIVREISQLAGGNGGGKKNFAQAGGKDISKVDDALSRAHEII
ncbi:alanine--tRNA ligase [Anaerococcus sp. mt242]|uniref:alanine--tRNA ligase n=1 Tax=Anaerococcus sp. mt242 TaxID=2661917 RepID=UPI001932892D|nr:alanine--tRNA ligase [Anaerococcus sp. mt242]MBM0045760.1 alanine--tRNA ligase [Anaerococcus sp. mt242]